MSISKNIQTLLTALPTYVTLVAVSKTKPIAAINEAYQGGQLVFGENKIQEMTEKWEALPKDIQWHMIGHIQTNKIKYMAPYVSLVHGVDRLKVLTELNKEAAKHKRIINCLLQVHIAEEETKFGFSSVEIQNLIKQNILNEFKNLNIQGLMGMASFTNDTAKVKSEFRSLKQLFDWSNSNNADFKTLSMGMSGDYNEAIEQGSNMIRVGSKIFGNRN